MYRVFISSTYSDLVEPRKSIINTILSLGHYPICMETFVATHGHQIEFIRKQLNTADIYVIILARRYGSCMDGDNCSYTEHEYEYAKQIGLPILAFVCDDNYNPSQMNLKTEPQHEDAWNKFAKKLKQEKLCKIWGKSEDLPSLISTAIVNLINDEIEGWIRESKYLKLKRKSIDDTIINIQKQVNIIIQHLTYQPSNCFIYVCNELISTYKTIQNLGLNNRDRIRFKKIDYIFYIISTKTEEYHLDHIIYYWYSQFLYDFHELDKAKDYAIKYLKFCNEDINKVRANNFIGLILWRMKSLPESINYLNKALEIFCNLYSTQEDNLANVIIRTKKLSDYINIEQKLILLGELYNNLGLNYDNSKNYDSAVKYYTYAKNTIGNLNNINCNKFLYKYQLYWFNLISAQFKKDNLSNDDISIVIDGAHEIIDILNKLPVSTEVDKRLARTYQLLGDTYYVLGNNKSYDSYSNALHFYDNVINTNNDYLPAFCDNNKNEIAWCLHKKSLIYIKLHQYINAKNCLYKAIDYREEIFLSSHIKEHSDYILNLAESTYLLSQLLFESCDKERNYLVIYNAARYGDDSFFYYEHLYGLYPKIYKQEYIEIAKLNLKICQYLQDKDKTDYYKNKLKLAS